MTQSMTAFARQEDNGEWGSLTLELRSVNHRYLEVNARLPEELRPLEPAIRTQINDRLGRGKVECGIRFQAPNSVAGELSVDHEFATQLAHASREVDALLYNPAPINSLDLLKWPGVLQVPGLDMELIKERTLAMLDQALLELVENRGREGDKLKAIILQRCDAMEKVVTEVRQCLPGILDGLRQRLRDRLAEVMNELDEQRVEQEMVILAQKLDVDEELDRLDTHVTEVRRVLEQNQPVGRRLDFLMQELNREANTLGSKSVDNATTNASVDLKVLIEQMREQIQNIE